LETPKDDAELSPRAEAQRKALADAMGVDLEDAPETGDRLSDDERAAADPSIASGQLTGDAPGQGSGEGNDGEADEAAAEDSGVDTAAEAEEAFVESQKAADKAPAKRSRKAKS